MNKEKFFTWNTAMLISAFFMIMTFFDRSHAGTWLIIWVIVAIVLVALAIKNGRL
jgi:hypothetical protein